MKKFLAILLAAVMVAAMFAGCGVVSLLVALATGSQVVVPVVMGCGPVAAVVLTKSAAHGVLIAAMSSGVSAWALMNTIHFPGVVFLLLLATYTGLVLLVRIPLRALEANLDEMRKKHRQEKLINDINQRILASRANDSLDLLTLESLCELTGKPGVIYRRTETGIESACLIPRWQIVYPTELSAAEKAFATGQRCGLSTEYFSTSSYLYIPIIAQNKILAVAAIRFGVGNPPDEEMATAIDLIIRQCALAMTRKDLVEEQHKIVMQSEKEKIRNDFLRAISHDLRTPLTSILGYSELLQNEAHSNPSAESCRWHSSPGNVSQRYQKYPDNRHCLPHCDGTSTAYRYKCREQAVSNRQSTHPSDVGANKP